jgi:hypothetical protein
MRHHRCGAVLFGSDDAVMPRSSHTLHWSLNLLEKRLDPGASYAFTARTS